MINDLAGRTGKKVMFAFNITADLDAMLWHHDAVLAAGGHVRDGEPAQRRPAWPA